MICAVAMVTREDAGAPFHVTVSPQISAMAAFQAKTAFGKLKAVMTPTVPKGFHTYIMKWSFRSELNTCPLNNTSDTQLFEIDRMPCRIYVSFLLIKFLLNW